MATLTNLTSGPAVQETAAAMSPDERAAAANAWLEKMEAEEAAIEPLRVKASLEPKHLTDLGNARRLVLRHGADLRYCHEWRQYLVYEGSRWRIDCDGEVQRRAKEVAESIYVEAALAGDADLRKKLSMWAVASESESRQRAMIALATSEPGIPVSVSQLDADPMLVNVKNGVIDLSTGTLRPNRREDYSTRMVPVTFDPTADCPRFRACLSRWLADDAESITFLQRAIGYTLTGRTDEQVLLFLFGHGANGKTVLLELLARLFGDYGMKADFATFLAGHKNGPRNDLAALVGARYVAAAETDEGQRWDEATLKAVTGGDTITARKLYADLFSYRPTFTLWFAANSKPAVRGTGVAMWRRIRLIPFTVTIPESERDSRLLDHLTTELPGILNWAVAGCLAWQRSGLGQAPAIREATESYRQEMDVLGGFLEQECTIRADARCPSSWLHKRYREWAERNGERPVSQVAFSQRLAERGYHKVKDSAGRMSWHGIGLDGGTEGHGGDSIKFPHERETREDYGNGELKGPNPPYSAPNDEELEERWDIEHEATR